MTCIGKGLSDESLMAIERCEKRRDYLLNQIREYELRRVQKARIRKRESILNKNKQRQGGRWHCWTMCFFFRRLYFLFLPDSKYLFFSTQNILFFSTYFVFFEPPPRVYLCWPYFFTGRQKRYPRPNTPSTLTQFKQHSQEVILFFCFPPSEGFS